MILPEHCTMSFEHHTGRLNSSSTIHKYNLCSTSPSLHLSSVLRSSFRPKEVPIVFRRWCLIWCCLSLWSSWKHSEIQASISKCVWSLIFAVDTQSVYRFYLPVWVFYHQISLLKILHINSSAIKWNFSLPRSFELRIVISCREEVGQHDTHLRSSKSWLNFL